MFWTVRAGEERLQAVLERDILGKDAFEASRHVRAGSAVHVAGRPSRSRRGEPSLMVDALEMLSGPCSTPPDHQGNAIRIEPA